MSEYEEMFSSNSDELKKKTILDIRAIINRRYLGMIKDGPSGDIYITSFFLEPREFTSGTFHVCTSEMLTLIIAFQVIVMRQH